MASGASKVVPDCPVCLLPLIPPKRVFQCGEGHFLCEKCKRNPSMKWCPYCRGQIVGRNIGMEQVIQAFMTELEGLPRNHPARPPGGLLMFNGSKLPLVVKESGTVQVTGGSRSETINCFAIGGGGGAYTSSYRDGKVYGGGGSGFINTGLISVRDGDKINIEIGNGGNYYENGESTRIEISGISVVAEGGERGGDIAGNGWSEGGYLENESSGGENGSPYWAHVERNGKEMSLPDVVCDWQWGRLVAGSGGKGISGRYGGGGGGVTFDLDKESNWASRRGEGFGAGGSGANFSCSWTGNSGLVVLH